MAREKKTENKRVIESYDHRDKQRMNNPPVGLVTPDTDPDAGSRKVYAYDPHLDPQLQWAGKAEHTSFEVPTVSLHVHERIDPRSIIEAVKKRDVASKTQMDFFGQLEQNLPLREAVEFYKHAHGWSNRFIAGDSTLVMNSMLEKEGLAGKVQMFYFDPPYGIKYGSNFQPFVNKRDVKDGKDDDLTSEPEQIRAFRDTWELGIHSYLTYLRDRLLLARELLTESGSVFVQISDENVHHVREIMDEVFGARNFVSQIYFATTGGFASGTLSRIGDYIVWYAKDKSQLKYKQLYTPKTNLNRGDNFYRHVELHDGSRRPLSAEERDGVMPIPEQARLLGYDNTASQGSANQQTPFEFEGKLFHPPRNSHWKAQYPDGMERLRIANRLAVVGRTLRYVRFLDNNPFDPLRNSWMDTSFAGYATDKRYVVETNTKVIERCLLMTTDPGDLVFDPTCGSGTTAYVAEQWGRRWITCDTSRVALTLAKQRLMTALFDYYELAHPHEGVGSGFKYKTVPHVTLKSIANNPDIREGMTRAQIAAAIARHAPQETLYDQPLLDSKRKRVSGPFTVEAVPAPAVKSVEDILQSGTGIPPVNHGQDDRATMPADTSVARSGETLRQNEWRDELLRTGIRGKAGQHIRFARLEPLPGCRWLHVDGESRPSDEGGMSIKEGGTAYVPQRIVVSFGPEHAPLEQKQVELAWEEARTLVPRPKIIIFAAFQFDPEAAKDVDEMKTELAGMQFLKVQMNADMLTDDLKKNRSSNESFWLIGQPDVVVNSEQWLVNSRKEPLAAYDIVTKLSGSHSLAEINGSGRGDLSLILAIAQRRDLWTAVATDAGGRVDSGKHCRGPGTARDGGVPAFSGHLTGITGRIGDAADFVRELGLLSEKVRRERIKRLRGNREIADRARQIATLLTGPLSTIHYSQVTVFGFDYYNTKTGDIESGSESQIAVWMLDIDYDGRSLYPRQVFFPMAGDKEGWARLAKNLRAEIDEELIEAYRGSVSLPFELEEHSRVAVKIVDDRGVESLKVVEVK